MSKSYARFGVLTFVLLLSTGAVADLGWVTNSGGTSVVIFDTSGNIEDSGSPITVGTAPIDIASDQADIASPGKIYVVNSGSASISVINAPSRVVVKTLSGTSGTGLFGSLVNPTGIARGFPVAGADVGPTLAVVDKKFTIHGKSTIRFIDPAIDAVVDEFADDSATANYVDVVYTNNGRFWITDDGDNGVVVVRLNGQSGPPFPFLGDRLIFTGPTEFADFIYDDAGAGTFLVNPQRLATNGTDRVVVADSGSDTLTIIDANYPADGEVPALPFVIVANVDLGLAGGATCIDVVVVDNGSVRKAYVTTTDPAKDVVVVDLTTNTVTLSLDLPEPAGGIGKTPDGKRVYVGTTAGAGTQEIFEIETTGDTVVTMFIPSTIAAPFGFQFTGVNFTGGFGGGGGGHICGALGLEAIFLLGIVGLFRRYRRLK